MLFLFIFSGHFLPRPTAPESLTPSTAKDDEVTSSEEANSAVRRTEQKGKLFINSLSIIKHLLSRKINYKFIFFNPKMMD